MQKWEYMVVRRYRGWDEKKRDEYWHNCGDWKVFVNGAWVEVDIEEHINKLGEQGWELVAIVAESDELGGATTMAGYNSTLLGGGQTSGLFTDIAGYTSTEKLYFKRPKA